MQQHRSKYLHADCPPPTKTQGVKRSKLISEQAHVDYQFTNHECSNMVANKRQINRKKTFTNEITQLQKELADSPNVNIINLLKDKIDGKINTFTKKTEPKLNGLMMRFKANIVEYVDKIANIFASLEKKRFETKLISRLSIYNSMSTNQGETITEIQSFYKNLHNKRQLNNSNYNHFKESMN